MKLNEIRAKAGPISDYFGYIILLFGWYLVNTVFITPHSEILGPGIDLLLLWGLKLLVNPVLLAVILGGIYEVQKTQDIFERKGFLSNIKTHLWRLLRTNLLSLIIFYVITLVAIISAGYESQQPDSNPVWLGFISDFSSTIELFWFSAVVVERKIFRGLARSIKTLLFHPVALAIGLLWAGSCAVDTFFTNATEQMPLVYNIAFSAFFAVAKVLAAVYFLVIYKDYWGIANEVAGTEIPVETAKTSPGEKLAKAGLGFTYVSFVPLLHLVALILGALALKRGQRFILKAAIACWVGGFFTIMYSLLVAGFIIGKSNSFELPAYTFLSAGNAEAEKYVALLDQGAYQEVKTQLGEPSENSSDRPWAFDCALALAEYQDNDLNGALGDFYAALQKKPERSEFYVYYGKALLDNDKDDMALEQFKLALAHDPNNAVAQQYISLIQNIYRPTTIESALMYIVILLISFSLHEYGHAFTAWKLGDDTAKNLGRVTLNPIAHLDIFGSILLPAILLLQQSGTVFGWAKPVPVNTENFKNPNRDHMLVSFAGPAVNLMVAMVSMIVLGLIALSIRVLWPQSISLNLADPSAAASLIGPALAKWILIVIVFLKQLFYTSLILGFLNLIPVPPLDGSWILGGVLPQGMRGLFDKARQFSFMFFILLTMTPVFDYFLSIPVIIAWLGLHGFVSVIGFG